MSTGRPPRGVPRDEWLLAIGLASHVPGMWKYTADVALDTADVALAIGQNFSDAFEAAWNAAAAMRRDQHRDSGDVGDPDAYAAGAALAMSLEEP